MNKQKNRFSLFEPSQKSTPPERYLSEEERSKQRKKRQQQMLLRCGAVGIAILAVLILIIVLIVKGCSGGTDVLKGKWDLDGTTAYEFSGDGNGALLLPNVTYEFTYKIKKDQVSIDYENESVRDGAYTFSVDKDKLTLIGGEGTVGGTYTLTRVEENK